MTTLDLRLYISILRRYLLVIGLVTMVTVTIVLAAASQITPVYQAQATVRVLGEVGVQDFRLGVEYGERLMNTYQHILTSWNTLNDAARRLGVNIPASELAEGIQVEIIPKSELMTISFEHSNPEFSRDFANALAALLIEYNQSIDDNSGPSTSEILDERLRSLEGVLAADQTELGRLLTERGAASEIAALNSRIEINESAYARLLERYEEAQVNDSLQAQRITITEYATLPTIPANILSLRDVAISIVAGIFAGVGLSLVLENVDTRIRTPENLERITDIPIIGTVPVGLLPLVTAKPSTNGFFKPPSFFRNGGSGNTKIEEAYKLVNINLQRLREQQNLRTLLVTSTRSHEEKTNVAINIAYMTAKDKNTVFLLEGDLREPTLGRTLHLDSEIGLTNFLVGLSPMSDMIQPTSEPTLFATRSGPTPPNPTVLLDSPLMEDVLQYLGAQAQMTLIDSSPILGTADVAILAPKVDGVVLVIKEEAANREQVSDAIKQLEATQANILGIIFLSKSHRNWH